MLSGRGSYDVVRYVQISRRLFNNSFEDVTSLFYFALFLSSTLIPIVFVCRLTLRGSPLRITFASASFPRKNQQYIVFEHTPLPPPTTTQSEPLL